MVRALSMFVAVLVATLLLSTLPGAAATRTLKATQECGANCNKCGSHKLAFGAKSCNFCCWNTGIPGADIVQEGADTITTGVTQATEVATFVPLAVGKASTDATADAVNSAVGGATKAIKKFPW